MKRKLAAACLIAVLSVSQLMSSTVSTVQADSIYNSKEYSVVSENNTLSNNSDVDFSKYSSAYYYNKMSAKQKELYDLFDLKCRSFMNSNDNLEYVESCGIYTLGKVTAYGYSVEEVNKVYHMFRISNPQYFFLSSVWLHYSADSYTNIWLCVHPNMKDLSTRTSMWKIIDKKLSSWKKQIDKYKTKKAKIKKIHNIVVNHVTYDDYLESHMDDTSEIKDMSQSVYPSIVNEKGVCTGYSFLFSMLCNASNIRCIVVDSKFHTWNKVLLGKKWYNIDCTWDDYDDGNVYYNYFLISDKKTKKNDSDNYHVLDTTLRGFVPSAK